MANAMKIRARMTVGVVEVKILMSHPEETGLRKNDAGEIIPAHYIRTVEIFHGERLVLSAQWGPAISANPFLAFKFEVGRQGDKVRVRWSDNRGDSRTDEVAIV